MCWLIIFKISLASFLFIFFIITLFCVVTQSPFLTGIIVLAVSIALPFFSLISLDFNDIICLGIVKHIIKAKS